MRQFHRGFRRFEIGKLFEIKGFSLPSPTLDQWARPWRCSGFELPPEQRLKQPSRTAI
jgi:hypothetical protein